MSEGGREGEREGGEIMCSWIGLYVHVHGNTCV